jgi:hypothetical protein
MENSFGCPIWQPSSLLVESMGSGRPSRRYKEDFRKKKEDLEGDMVQKKLGEEIAARNLAGLCEGLPQPKLRFMVGGATKSSNIFHRNKDNLSLD